MTESVSRRGIRPFVNRFSHTAINVSDLDRSVEFYEETFPVRRLVRINGPAQAFPGLGIERGEVEGWVLESRSSAWPPGDLTAEFPPRRIHLLQWKTPESTGAPYRDANNLGIYRQNSLVGDLDAAYEKVVAAGGRPYGPPTPIILTPEGFAVRTFGFRDPDGTTLQMMGPETPDPSYVGAGYHCNINVSDLKRAHAFYRNILGLDHIIYLEPGEPQPVTNGNLGDSFAKPDGSPAGNTEMDFRAVFLGVRTDSRTPVDLVEWKDPKPYGAPYPSPTNLGIQRIALEVDDLDAAREVLQQETGAPAREIDTWDLGDAGVHRVLIFEDPDGTSLELVEQHASPGNPVPPDFA